MDEAPSLDLGCLQSKQRKACIHHAGTQLALYQGELLGKQNRNRCPAAIAGGICPWHLAKGGVVRCQPQLYLLGPAN